MKIIRVGEIPEEIRGNGSYSIKRIITKKFSKNPENVGIYETTIPKGNSCGCHFHKNLDEILLFLTKAEMNVEGDFYILGEGDIVILSPGEKHEFFAEENEIKIIALKFPNIPEDKFDC